MKYETKAEFVKSQLKWNESLLTGYDRYIENDQFNNQEKEENYGKNIDSSRHAE